MGALKRSKKNSHNVVCLSYFNFLGARYRVDCFCLVYALDFGSWAILVGAFYLSIVVVGCAFQCIPLCCKWGLYLTQCCLKLILVTEDLSYMRKTVNLMAPRILLLSIK